jgi:DNA-directed RNA polymerase subunit K/omega
MSPDKGNKYRDVLITAKRARQLQGGASPQVTSKSMKFSRVAQEELAAGKIDAGSVGYKIASEYKAEADIAADFAAQQRSSAVRETAVAEDTADLDDLGHDLEEA